MESCLYEGHVRHQRFAPVSHSFCYRLFLVYLDLAELDLAFRGRWLWSTRRPALARFCREDHLGDPRQTLDGAVRDLVEARSGKRPDGPIRLLTHLRYFGYAMNPVSFFYCFSADGRTVRHIVAEVTNTPWGETYPYVLSRSPDEALDWTRPLHFPKQLHVSPFWSMEQTYAWSFVTPGERLAVHMENLESGSRVFAADMALTRRPMTGANLARVLFRYPLMTGKVIAAIYWQAFLLWRKRCPYIPHPRHAPSTTATRVS
jgi:hypothetical protein